MLHVAGGRRGVRPVTLTFERYRDEEKLDAFLSSDIQKSGQGIDKICIDVANGYSEPFAEFVRKMRDKLPGVRDGCQYYRLFAF